MGGLVRTGNYGWGMRRRGAPEPVVFPPPTFMNASGHYGLSSYPNFSFPVEDQNLGGEPWVQVSHQLNAGSNRVAIVFVSVHNATSDTPGSPDAYVVTFGGDSMQLIASATRSSIHHSVNYLALGGSGSGVRKIRVTFSHSGRAMVMIHIVILANAKQAAPIFTARQGNTMATQAAPYAPEADVQEANSFIVDSISVDDDRTPTITGATGSAGHQRRAATDVDGDDANQFPSEYYQVRSRAMATATKIHPASGTQAHPWWWTGGSMGYTWLAAEIKPFGT